MPQTTDWADVQVVGIPRALLFYRFGVLWTTFFESIGRTVVVSDPDGQGHRRWGRSSFRGRVLPGLEGVHRARGKPCGPLRRRLRALLSDERPPQRFCTKFQSATDMVAQYLPRRQAARHLLRGAKCPEGEGRAPRLLRHGRPHGRRAQGRPRCLQGRLGRPARPRRGAGHRPGAHAAPPGRRAPAADAPPRPGDDAVARPLGILVVAHPYISHDPYLSGAVIDSLEDMGATVVYADAMDHERAYKKSFEFSGTMPWLINRELIGSILLAQMTSTASCHAAPSLRPRLRPMTPSCAASRARDSEPDDRCAVRHRRRGDPCGKLRRHPALPAEGRLCP